MSRVGDLLASKYRLGEPLGSGGMGHVYRAVNVEIERVVAIKILRSEHATNPQLVERFLREARAANLVRHPNVVDVVDVGRDVDGSPFIVQELLEGEDLAKLVERRGGALSIAEIEEYLLPVIDAVAVAHGKGVVHRDLKPENVFLANEGGRRVPKLLDFGISKIRQSNVRMTEVGMMMGTPAYMPPEQVHGARDADPRSDIWALGVMLFELLSGRLPFDAEDAPALFVAIATQDVPRLIDVAGTVSPSVSLVVERCLRRSPAERYPSALELARDLRHAVVGEDLEPTQTRSIPVPAREPPLAIPELALPLPAVSPRAAAEAKVPSDVGAGREPSGSGAASARTLAGASGLDLAIAPPSSRSGDALGPLAVPDLDVRPTSARAPASAPAVRAAPSVSRPPVQLAQGDPRSGPPSSRSGPPSSRSGPPSPRPPPESGGWRAGDHPLPGVMFAGATTSSRRPPAGVYAPAPREGPTDMSFLVGLAVVGLVSIGVTAVATTLLGEPEGWSVATLVMKPTAEQRLAVQGGLGLLALVVAGKLAVSGVRNWPAPSASRGASVVCAVLAGGLFFVALQLARAAW